MKTMSDRRSVLALAWAAPTLTVTTTAPAFATSTLGPSRLRFTNITATVGKERMVVYANTRVQVVDGPNPVQDVTLTVTVGRHPPHVYRWPSIAGWGSTEQVRVEQPGEWSKPIPVTFTATAEGMEPITATATVNPPGWWFE